MVELFEIRNHRRSKLSRDAKRDTKVTNDHIDGTTSYREPKSRFVVPRRDNYLSMVLVQKVLAGTYCIERPSKI
jgi:hypothetical protein